MLTTIFEGLCWWKERQQSSSLSPWHFCHVSFGCMCSPYKTYQFYDSCNISRGTLYSIWVIGVYSALLYTNVMFCMWLMLYSHVNNEHTKCVFAASLFIFVQRKILKENNFLLFQEDWWGAAMELWWVHMFTLHYANAYMDAVEQILCTLLNNFKNITWFGFTLLMTCLRYWGSVSHSLSLIYCLIILWKV